jgi:hypothetical protein
MLDARLGFSLWVLRLGYGVLFVVSGLEKFNSLGTPTRVAGVVELLAGVLVFTPFTRTAAHFLGGWLVLLALVAATLGQYDMAVRDALLAVGAFVLARLMRVNEGQPGPVAAGSPTESRVTATEGTLLAAPGQTRFP